MLHELVHTTRHVALTAFSNIQTVLCRHVTEISNTSGNGCKYDTLNKYCPLL